MYVSLQHKTLVEGWGEIAYAGLLFTCLLFYEVYRRFPESHFPGMIFPLKTFPGKKIMSLNFFVVKQTMAFFLNRLSWKKDAYINGDGW